MHLEVDEKTGKDILGVCSKKLAGLTIRVDHSWRPREHSVMKKPVALVNWIVNIGQGKMVERFERLRLEIQFVVDVLRGFWPLK